MAWIEVHQSLISHRKTLTAAELLGIKPVHLVGHLVALWLWSLDNVPDGDLDGTSPRIIAFAAQWDGDPDALIAALVEAQFLDHADDGSLFIHDWHDYAGKLIDRREANTERQRRHRERTHFASPQPVTTNTTSALPNTSVTRDIPVTSQSRNGATVPNRTQPNRTVPNSTEPCNTDIQVVVSGEPLKESGAKPADKPPPQMLSPGQRLFLDRFGRKRFATAVQAKAVADLESEVGLDVLDKATAWGAEKGVVDFHAIQTTARKIAKDGRKEQNSGGPSKTSQGPRGKYAELYG